MLRKLQNNYGTPKLPIGYVRIFKPSCSTGINSKEMDNRFLKFALAGGFRAFQTNTIQIFRIKPREL